MAMSSDLRSSIALILVFSAIQIMFICILRILTYFHERRLDLEFENQPTVARPVNPRQIHHRSFGGQFVRQTTEVPLPAPTAIEGLTLTEDQARSLCSICLDQLGNAGEVTVIKPCEHMFHLICIVEWTARRYSCPVCRDRIANILIVSKLTDETENVDVVSVSDVADKPANVDAVRPENVDVVSVSNDTDEPENVDVVSVSNVTDEPENVEVVILPKVADEPQNVDVVSLSEVTDEPEENSDDTDNVRPEIDLV